MFPLSEDVRKEQKVTAARVGGRTGAGRDTQRLSGNLLLPPKRAGSPCARRLRPGLRACEGPGRRPRAPLGTPRSGQASAHGHHEALPRPPGPRRADATFPDSRPVTQAPSAGTRDAGERPRLPRASRHPLPHGTPRPLAGRTPAPANSGNPGPPSGRTAAAPPPPPPPPRPAASGAPGDPAPPPLAPGRAPGPAPGPRPPSPAGPTPHPRGRGS